MTARLFDAVDLGGLPAPQMIEPLDYETTLAASLADFAALFPGYDAPVESDPIMKVLEVFAWRELLLRARVNDGGRAVMLAFATGADLDHLAALFGIARLVIDAGDAEALPPRDPVQEADANLRRRIQLSLEAATAAGTAGRYLFYALGADPLVVDASVTSPSPGRVRITVLSLDDGGVASAALLAAVDAVVQDEDVRQLCDTVEVAAATLLPVTIAATLHYLPGAARSAARIAAIAAIDALIAEAPRLGRPVARSAIFAALHVDGVSRVVLSSPVDDISIDPTTAAQVVAVVVTDG
jgi:phage-related baseplate assembly protein